MAEVGVKRATKRKDRGVERVLIEAEAVQQRVRELAEQLDAVYANETPLLIGVLTGAITFMTDLMREMGSELKVDFMAVSSYGDDVTSSGAVRILKDLNENIEGRHVLIVEDIVDSGLTLNYLLDVLRRRNPSDLKVVALLRKQKPDAIEVQTDFVGFEIPDEFVIGYGLDYAGRYRNLPYIGVLDLAELEVAKSPTAILPQTPPLPE
jgi:hypoxanthine phosphoribosyltransferase